MEEVVKEFDPKLSAEATLSFFGGKVSNLFFLAEKKDINYFLAEKKRH